MARALKFVMWVLVAISVVVILATIASMLGGYAYVEAVWQGLPFAGSLAVWAVFGVLAMLLYFVPTIIAFMSNHHNALPILFLNALLGWTFLGWVGALVWSLMKPPPVKSAE